MTATPWDRIGTGPWPADMVVPTAPAEDAVAEERDLPPTLRPVAGEGVRQRPVFDPAARHHNLGMRLSEPDFEDDADARIWRSNRRAALDAVLAAVADSPWANHLVLRGSALLPTWLGAAAREPGDIDFVVVPRDWAIDEPRTDEMLTGIARSVAAAGGPVTFDAGQAVRDGIWTYDRVPGLRLMLPWTPVAPDARIGSVQVDFVFGEELPEEPVRTRVEALSAGSGATLLSASPSLSLAWKIQWLGTDKYPEGKDLYDAVLLAEHRVLPGQLPGVLEPAWRKDLWFPVLFDELVHVEWDEFAKDRPEFAGRFDEMIVRLFRALVPAVGGADAAAELFVSAWSRWIEQLRAGVADGGLDRLEEALAVRYLDTARAFVLARAVLGPARAPRGIADLLTEIRARRGRLTRFANTVDPHEVAAIFER